MSNGIERFTLYSYKIEIYTNREFMEILSQFQWKRDWGCIIATISKDKLLFYYKFGAITFFNIEKSQIEELLNKIKEKTGNKKVVDESLGDHIDVIVNHEGKVDVTFDEVILPSFNLNYIKIISLALAQSTALEAYENQVDSIIEFTQKIDEELMNHGKYPYRTKELIKFVGRCMRTRRDLMGRLSLLDKPEITWEDELLDKLYEDLREELEMVDRVTTLEHKILALENDLLIIMELAQNRRFVLLELLIIILIFVDIVIYLLQ